MRLATLQKPIAELKKQIQIKQPKPEAENIIRPVDEWFDSLYPWQDVEFIGATKEFSEVCLCAANQVGKTRTGTGIDACHALGDYPRDWEGHTFKHPPTIWILGYSGEKTRDLLQTKLFGLYLENEFQGGYVPKERIKDHQSMSGTAGAMRTVRVRHSTGGISTVQFWSYSQGQHALMGDSVDWFHIDEEPKDQTIYPQVITRTANGDLGEGGRGILTFTPENGRTELVCKFMDSPGSGQCFIRKGWDDAPHLNELTKQKLLESYPEHQKDMRTKGLPMLGHGRIYDLAESFITCDPFEIPDHWLLINGMDFGWDHPQAHIQLAIDLDNDIVYLTHAWKCSKVSANDAWGSVKSWADGVPTAWPHDGLQHEKGRDDSRQQKDHYEEAGFLMLEEHATWDDTSNSVEQGIYELRLRMQSGRFKVFRGQRDFFDEFLQYHRDDKGKLVKIKDDCLDAVRYAYMMRRFAIPKGEVNTPALKVIPKPLKPIGKR